MRAELLFVGSALLLAAVAVAATAQPLPLSSTGRVLDYDVLDYRSVLVADFDGDGKEDVALVGVTPDAARDIRIRVLFGPLAGFEGPEAVLGVNADFPIAFACVGELTGDGIPDLYVVGTGGHRTYRVGPGRVLAGIGTPVTLATLGPIGVGDFDQDGVGDILLADGAHYQVLLNDGSGQLSIGTGEIVTTHPPVQGEPIADFDGDGLLDVVGRQLAQISIMRGQPGAAFIPGWAVFSAAGTVGAVITPDFDADGDPDIVALVDGGGSIQGIRNDGGGTFTPLVPTPISIAAYGLLAIDLDADDGLDIAFHATSGILVGWSRGLGDGTFTGTATFTAGLVSRDLAAFDVDGDGRRDLLVSADRGLTLVAIPARPQPVTGVHRVSTAVQVKALATGDVNGDGRGDFLALGSVPPSIAFHLTAPSGAAWTRSDLPVEASPQDLLAADLDGDGVLDLALAHGTSGLSLRHGLGGGAFAPPITLTTPPQVRRVRSADFDGDGVLDLVVGCEGATAFRTFRGLGGFAFGAGVDVNSDAGIGGMGALHAVDLTQDGRPDLLALRNSGIAYLHPALPGGGFDAAATFALGGAASGLDFGDLDGDGVFDLAAVRPDGRLVHLRGTGGGTFAAEPGLDLGDLARGVRIADIDGDGHADAVTIHGAQIVSFSIGGVTLARSLGGGAFAPPLGMLAGLDPRALAVADVTGDGRPDVVVATPGDTSATILVNLVNGPVSVPSVPLASALVARVAPSPAFGPFGVELAGLPGETVRLEVFTVDGRRIGVARETRLGADGRGRITMSAGARPGIYLVRAVQRAEVSVARAVVLP